MKCIKALRDRRWDREMEKEHLALSKPCTATCCKCGSSETNLTYYPKGTKESKMFSTFGFALGTEFVEEDYPAVVVAKDCIVYHCKCCGFDWISAPLNI